MLMKPDAKKAVSIIVEKAKGPNHIDNLKPQPSEDGVQVDDSVPSEAAAEDLLQAIQANSPKGIVEAVKSLIDLCRDED